LIWFTTELIITMIPVLKRNYYKTWFKLIVSYNF